MACPGPSSLPTSCTALEKPSEDERQEPTSPTEAEACPPVCPEVLQLGTVGAPAQAAQSPGPPLPQRHRVQGQSHPSRAGRRYGAGSPAQRRLTCQGGEQHCRGWETLLREVHPHWAGCSGVSVATHMTEDGTCQRMGTCPRTERARGRGRGQRSHPLQEGQRGGWGPVPPKAWVFAQLCPPNGFGGSPGVGVHGASPENRLKPRTQPKPQGRDADTVRAGPLLIPRQRKPLCRLILCFHASWDKSRKLTVSVFN